MDVAYIILPILGAFLLLFTVCCCGDKMKQLLHIPKQVAIGHVMPAPREFEQNSSDDDSEYIRGETRSRVTNHGRVNQSELSVLVIEQNASEENEEIEDGFRCKNTLDFSSIGGDPASSQRLRHQSHQSERDSGVFPEFQSSISIASQKCSRLQDLGQFNSSCSDESHSAFLRAEEQGSCVINVRTRNWSGDTCTTVDNGRDLNCEDAGFCILHVQMPATTPSTPDDVASFKEVDESSRCNSSGDGGVFYED